MNKNVMRCFIAVPVFPELARICAELGHTAASGHPVPAENLHLTLAFLDNQPSDALSDLQFELGAVRYSAFSVGFSGLGQFGSALHLAVTPDPALSHLQDKIMRCARRCGMDLPRRRFRPHVTIVRGLNSSLNRSIFQTVGRNLTMDITRFDLMSSTLRPDGPRYDILTSYPLTAYV